MKALAVALVLAAVARADVPADAPVVVKAGSMVPADGVLLPDAAAVSVAKRLTSCEARVPVLEDGLKNSPSWWVVAVVGVVALGAGVGLGVGIDQAVRK